MKKILLINFLLLIPIISYYYSIKKYSKLESPFEKYAALIPNTYRIGFTNLDTEVHIAQLQTTGKIPKWLNGTLYRNGPTKFTTTKSFVNNWFDGLAMLHSFKIQNGQVAYTNKFLKTNEFDYVKSTNLMNYFGYVQDPCESIFAKWASSFSSKLSAPNANVNIAKFSNHYTALTETPLPIEFDNESLQTIGPLVYEDQHPKQNVQECVHPHYDSSKQENISYFTTFGFESAYDIYKIKDGTTKREVLSKIKSSKPAYMHTFAITQNYIILVELPLRANKFSFMFKNKAFINNFDWQEELGTNFIVVDRNSGKEVAKLNTKAFFAFHIVNAFQADENINIDIVTYPDSSVIKQSFFSVLLSDIKVVTNYQIALKRFTLNLNNKTIAQQILSNAQLELPRINYDQNNGKLYKYLYAVSRNNDLLEPFYVANKLIKISVENLKTLEWQENDCYPGEPVFIQKPNSTEEEDDGVILSVVLQAKIEKSFLLILNAKNFKEIARAHLPHHIPFGIHGQFY